MTKGAFHSTNNTKHIHTESTVETMPGQKTRTHKFEETPQFLELSLSHLRDALDLIPITLSYTEALRLAPRLVETESDPIKFLRSEGFNPWKAAQKLVLYWDYRKNLFKDRWLLPLDETGSGALTEKDLETLRSGWLVYLAHEEERYFLMDHGRCEGRGFDSFLRVLFYLGTMAPDAVAQTVGGTSIRLISSSKGEPPLSVEFYQAADMAWKMTKEALPYRIRQIVFLKQDAIKGSILQFYLQRIGARVMGLLGSGTAMTVTVPSVTQAANILMETMGISRHALPVNHGGTWTYDRMNEWKGIAGRCENDDANSIDRNLWQSDPVDRSRDMRSMRKRRNYAKRKFRQFAVEEQAEQLFLENKRLKRENEFLEALVEQALDVDALLTFDEDQNLKGHTTLEPESLSFFYSGAAPMM